MPCYYPVTAWQHIEGGQLIFAERKNHRQLTIPCGRCFGCRLDRSKMWAIRCMHESKMHDVNAYITLTYDEDHVPVNGSLNYKHFQDFMKRLRKSRGLVRFYMCGEYGEDNWRPHFHALLFGVSFPDRKYLKKNGNGDDLYDSVELHKLWPFGKAVIGEVTFESAAYIARYVMKKVTGDRSLEHYTRMSQYGEVVQLTPEFAHMSLKPGIGATWFAKFKSDVYNTDTVVCNGREFKPPKYYDKLLRVLCDETGSFEDDDVRSDRQLKPVRWEDQTEPRLRAREAVARAKANFRRNVE